MPARDTIHQRMRDRYMQVVDPLIPPKTLCALVGFPNHTNVGDSMIWSGMCTYLKQRNIQVVYACDRFTYSRAALESYIKHGAHILLHGGGNLGDIWSAHEMLREQVLKDFPNTEIIQFPQTIHFDHPENVRRAAAVLNKHKHFTLLVRDDESLSFARKNFAAPSFLCPDSAFWLSSPSRIREPVWDILWLSRTDKEALQPDNSDRFMSTSGIHIADWIQKIPDLQTALCYFAARTSQGTRALGMAGVSHVFSSVASSLFNRVAESNIERGIRLFSKARVIITDRLHGHILCLLMGIPHVLLDNSYGKLSSFYHTWTSDSPLARRANSRDQAIKMARALSQRS